MMDRKCKGSGPRGLSGFPGTTVASAQSIWNAEDCTFLIFNKLLQELSPSADTKPMLRDTILVLIEAHA